MGATLRYTATGIFPLTNVDTQVAGALVIQTRLASGSATWALRKRLTGTSPGVSGTVENNVVAVPDLNAPRTYFSNALTGEAVNNATAITATTAPQIHSVICDGCDVLLEVLSIAGELLVDVNPVSGAT